MYSAHRRVFTVKVLEIAIQPFIVNANLRMHRTDSPRRFGHENVVIELLDVPGRVLVLVTEQSSSE